MRDGVSNNSMATGFKGSTCKARRISMYPVQAKPTSRKRCALERLLSLIYPSRLSNVSIFFPWSSSNKCGLNPVSPCRGCCAGNHHFEKRTEPFRLAGMDLCHVLHDTMQGESNMQMKLLVAVSHLSWSKNVERTAAEVSKQVEGGGEIVNVKRHT